MAHISFREAGLLLSAAFLQAPAAAQTRWYVDASAAPNGNGHSWSSALRSLDDALELANRYDHIWVADGTYTPSLPASGDPRKATFYIPRDLSLFGGFEGWESTLLERVGLFEQTVMSGDVGVLGNNTDNAYHVIETWGDVVIDGFRITGGNAVGAAVADGGGLLLTVGQIMVDPDLFQGSGLRLRHSTIDHNVAVRGAGLYGNLAGIQVSHCKFSANEALGDGGAVNLQTSHARFDLCDFAGNRAGGNGGALHFVSIPTDGTGRPRVGLVGCLLRENLAVGSGGGLSLGAPAVSASGKAFIANCTVALNTGMSGGGGIYAQNALQFPAVGWLENSIVFHNRGPNSPDVLGSLVCWNSIAPGQVGPGVSSANPRFVSVRAKDLRLRADSPAIDVGDFNRLPFDVADIDEDGFTAERIPIDLDGTTRVLGAGVDLGAFERP